MAYIRVIREMYSGVKISVRIEVGDEYFSVKIGLYYGLTLS